MAKNDNGFFDVFYSFKENFYGSICELIGKLDREYGAVFFKGRVFIGPLFLKLENKEEHKEELLSLVEELQKTGTCSKKNAKLWSEVVMQSVFEEKVSDGRLRYSGIGLLRQFSGLVLSEFVYFDIKKLHVEKSDSSVTVEFEFFFVARSMVGKDLRGKFARRVAECLRSDQDSAYGLRDISILKGPDEAIEY